MVSPIRAESGHANFRQAESSLMTYEKSQTGYPQLIEYTRISMKAESISCRPQST
jgi:hypothetical protein